MAINWRQRAPILRVLAAVYAELGEEAFKGRYGRIAKLYGNNATYDAIKSFFAKEIVKLAEELKDRNLDGGTGRNRTPRPQRSGAMQRPLRLDFDDNDDDVIVMGEREVQMEERSSQPAKAAMEGRAYSESLHDGYDPKSPIRGSNGVHARNPGHLPSVTPGPSSRAGRQVLAFEVSPEQQAPNRKRPYSVLEESDSIPPSFGYVTNRGKHRCALCMTELPSAEVLRKHESMSKLHLANLRDPLVVSRGCVTLAQVTSLADTTSRPQKRRELAPLTISGFDRREEAMAGQHFDQRGDSSPGYGRSRSLMTENENDYTLDTINVAEPRNGSMRPPRPQPDVSADSRGSETGQGPDIEVVQKCAVDKGKRRAQTVPRDPTASASAQSQPNVGKERSAQQQRTTTAVPRPSPSDAGLTDIAPTLLAQILLSSGMELLAKKCIEEHPELRAGFFKCMQEIQGSGGIDAADMRERA